VFVAYPPQREPWVRFDVHKYLDVFKDSDDEGMPLFEKVQHSNLD